MISQDHPAVEPPCIGDLEYWGIQRLPWEDIDDEFYVTDILPPDIARLRQQIRDQNCCFGGLDLCYTTRDAAALLNHSNRHEIKNELIVVSADWLNVFRSEITVSAQRVHWLGYDIVACGSWSLIADGCFRHPTRFQNWVSELNEYGLFVSLDSWRDFVNFYRQMANEAVVEPVPDGWPIAPIRVGRYSPE